MLVVTDAYWLQTLEAIHVVVDCLPTVLSHLLWRETALYCSRRILLALLYYFIFYFFKTFVFFFFFNVLFFQRSCCYLPAVSRSVQFSSVQFSSVHIQWSASSVQFSLLVQS